MAVHSVVVLQRRRSASLIQINIGRCLCSPSLSIQFCETSYCFKSSAVREGSLGQFFPQQYKIQGDWLMLFEQDLGAGVGQQGDLAWPLH